MLYFNNQFCKYSRCIFTSGPIQPTIVLGLSGKPSKLVNLEKTSRSHNDDYFLSTIMQLILNNFSDNISLVRRFSGGGTVIVDHSTVFITFIMNVRRPILQPNILLLTLVSLESRHCYPSLSKQHHAMDRNYL